MTFSDALPSNQSINELIGDIPVLPQHPEGLETFVRMEEFSDRQPNFLGVFPYVSSRSQTMDPEQEEGFVKKCFEFFEDLMTKYENPRFAVHCFEYLFERTEGLPLEQTGELFKKAYNLFSIIDGYEEPIFTRNFFGYLFEKSMDFEDQKQRELVCVAHEVVAVTLDVFGSRTEDDIKIISAYDCLKPGTNFRQDLGFTSEDYTEFRNLLPKEMKPFDQTFKPETVADCIQYIVENRFDITVK